MERYMEKFVRETCFPRELVSSDEFTKMHSVVAGRSPTGSLGKENRSNMVHNSQPEPEDDSLICGPSLARIPWGKFEREHYANPQVHAKSK